MLHIVLVGLTWDCLQLKTAAATTRAATYSYNRQFPSRLRFPEVKHSVCKYNNTYQSLQHCCNCSTVQKLKSNLLIFSVLKTVSVEATLRSIKARGGAQVQYVRITTTTIITVVL